VRFNAISAAQYAIVVGLAFGDDKVIADDFSTRLHDEAQGAYGVHYMPITPITVPASLAPFVAGVSLDDIVNMATPHTGGSEFR
jgi:hypothetical protein